MSTSSSTKPGSTLVLLAAFLPSLMATHARAQEMPDCVTPGEPETSLMGGGGSCSDEAMYTPDPANGWQNTPNLVFRLAYHFVRPTDGSGPYAGDLSALVNAEVNGLNWFYNDIQPPTLPVSPAAQEIPDCRVRFVLYGIYYHDDDARYTYHYNLQNHHNCSTNLRDEFGVMHDEVINIFYYRSYWGGSYGCGPQTFVNMINCMPEPTHGLLAHELGHALGLNQGAHAGHTFRCSGSSCFDDNFTDTYHPDCNTGWVSCGAESVWAGNCTGVGVSNNIMGYNSCRRYLSPMQMARIHNFNINTPHKRKYVKCTPDAFNPTIVISQSTVWESSKIINSNIEIQPGITLDVRCTLYLSPHAKIIVKQGAKLIVDGGILTAHSGSCNDFWPGIEVWGSNAHNQSPSYHPTHQGMVVLKNGAVIEHAREAITMQDPSTYWTFGGVVQATDATFLNCRRAVEFLSYQHTTPGGAEIPNRSFFTRVNFIVDENYRGGDDFYAQVSMWDVHGINFTACNFENRQNENALIITQSAKLGYGIISEDASYRVRGQCATNPPWLGDVCPSYIPTVFKGFDHGINARNFGSARNFIVSNCHFEDNVCGVYANGVVGFQVKNSHFLVGGNEVPILSGDVDEQFNDRHRAVFSTESWAFAIDDNAVEQSGNHDLTEGIVVGYSRDHNDVVFRNEATGLERAYIGEGICADLAAGYTATRGLWFLCNENDDNSTNFWARKVFTDQVSELNTHTIRLNQGMPSRPADNTFDQWAVGSGKWDFRLTTTHSPVIYWHRNTGNFVPVSYTISSTGLFPAPATGIPTNNCAQKVLLTIPYEPDFASGMAPGPVVQYLLDEKLAYGNTRYLYEQLIDDGNTDEVVLEIQESWPQDAWELRASLLSRSPYLSTTVLREMVLRNIMPTAMVTEILVANPAATRSDGFLTWLQEESGYPLPEYLLGMVVASWDERGYRDALEAEMTLHHAEMTQAANLLIHHYHTLPLAEEDSTGVPMDSVLWVWQQVRTPAARYAEALTWMQLGNYAQASDVIASLPTEHKLRSPDEQERQRMLDLIGFVADIRGNGRSEMQLDSGEVAYLKVLMGDAYDRPAALISNLLCFGYGHCRPPLTGGEDNGEPKALPYTPLPPKAAVTQAELRIHPNPASTWVAIDYDLLVQPTDAAIIIRDMTGREVKRIMLREQQHQVVWDTRQAAPGSYTVVLQNKQRQLRVEKLIIRQ